MRDIRLARRQAKLLADELGVSARKLAAASRQFRCPVASAEIPAIAGGFHRFADVFPAYSMQNPCEKTTQLYLPRILETEEVLTNLYVDWLTEILRGLFPDAVGRSVTVSDILARTGENNLFLDAFKQS